MLIQFLLSFFLVFVLLPSIVTPFKHEAWLDRFFIAFTHSTLFFIIAVHVLTTLHLYETFSLVMVCALAVILLYRVYTKHQSISKGTILLVQGMELLDDRNQLKKTLRNGVHSLRTYIQESVQSCKQLLKKRWLIALSIAATLGFAAYIRFKHAVTHLYFGASDPYVHMALANFLKDNDIFGDGVYPQGFPAIISTLNVFFNIDTYTIIRFIGPTAGILIVLSIFFSVRKIVGAQYWLIFISLFIYSVYAGLPSYVWRQISALSMEYGVIFILPGIAFFVHFLRKKEYSYLILAGECLAIILFIHPYPAAALALSYFIISLCYWKVMLLPKVFLRFLMIMSSASVLGVLPIVFAYLAGKAQPTNETYALDAMKEANEIDLSNWIQVLSGSDRLMLTILIVCFFIIIYKVASLLLQKKSDPETPSSDSDVMAFVFIFLSFYLIYQSPSLGLPVLIPSDRFGVFFAVIGAAAIGIMLHFLFNHMLVFQNRKKLKSLVVLFIAGTILLSGNIQSAPIGSQYQYEDNLKVLINIKQEFDNKNWTIVSAGEEFPMVHDYGYHYQLWEFAQTLAFPEDEELEFPTDDIFIYVEKIPLDSQSPVTQEEASADFPVAEEDANVTDFYYRDIEHRRIINARVFTWAENRMLHRNDMSIFYDSPVLRVYHIEQDWNNPTDLLL